MSLHGCCPPNLYATNLDVWQCPVCGMWWRVKYGPDPYWDMTTRLRLILTGLGRQCRAHNAHEKDPR